MSESRNIRSYLSVRDAMKDSDEIRRSAEIAVQAKQAELRSVCEGGNLYVQGECGECDKAIKGAPLDAYPPEDQAFYRFWYGHMKNDLMQPPLVGISHATARYIWDAARSAAAGVPEIVSTAPPSIASSNTERVVFKCDNPGGCRFPKQPCLASCSLTVNLAPADGVNPSDGSRA